MVSLGLVARLPRQVDGSLLRRTWLPLSSHLPLQGDVPLRGVRWTFRLTVDHWPWIHFWIKCCTSMLALATLNWERPTVAEDVGLQWTTQHWLVVLWLHCDIVCQNHSKGHATWRGCPWSPHSERALLASETQLQINWHFWITYSLQTERISNLLLKIARTIYCFSLDVEQKELELLLDSSFL